MKSSSHDIKKEIKDYIREGHINKDKLIDHLLDFLSKDELQDFVIMYNYMTKDELSESVNGFSEREWQVIRDTIDKFYPEYRGQYTARFLDAIQMHRLSDDCYVDLDDAKDERMVSDADIENMVTVDKYYVGGSDNVAAVSMLNPKDGRIYEYVDF